MKGNIEASKFIETARALALEGESIVQDNSFLPDVTEKELYSLLRTRAFIRFALHCMDKNVNFLIEALAAKIKDDKPLFG